MMRRMMLALLIVAFSGALAVAGAPPSRGDVAERVKALLVGFEKVPTEADWQAAGPREVVASVLLEVAQDSAARASTRARAVTSMRYADSQAVRGYLSGLIGDEKAQPLLRRKAMLSYGAVARDEALPVLQPMLDVTDVHVREAAIQGIAAIDTRAALSVLDAHIPREAVEHVRETASRLASELRARVQPAP